MIKYLIVTLILTTTIYLNAIEIEVIKIRTSNNSNVFKIIAVDNEVLDNEVGYDYLEKKCIALESTLLGITNNKTIYSDKLDFISFSNIKNSDNQYSVEALCSIGSH